MFFSNTDTRRIIPNAMLRSSYLKNISLQNIALVLFLSFSMLWINSAVATHIHLNEHAHEHQDEFCLSLHSGATTLETNVSNLILTAAFSKNAINLVKKPQLIPIAPCNSRAPPFHL